MARLNAKSKQMLFFCLYRILLDVVYINGVAPTYSYAGFVTEREPIIYIFSWILFLIYAIRLTPQIVYIKNTEINSKPRVFPGNKQN